MSQKAVGPLALLRSKREIWSQPIVCSEEKLLEPAAE